MKTPHHSGDGSTDLPLVEIDDAIELLEGCAKCSPRETAENWIARASSPPELVAFSRGIIALEDAMDGFNAVAHTFPAVKEAIENWHAANRVAAPAARSYADFLKARNRALT